MLIQNATEMRHHIIYREDMKEIDNSRDLGTDGNILNLLLKIGPKSGGTDVTGSVKGPVAIL